MGAERGPSATVTMLPLLVALLVSNCAATTPPIIIHAKSCTPDAPPCGFDICVPGQECATCRGAMCVAGQCIGGTCKPLAEVRPLAYGCAIGQRCRYCGNGSR